MGVETIHAVNILWTMMVMSDSPRLNHFAECTSEYEQDDRTAEML